MCLRRYFFVICFRYETLADRMGVCYNTSSGKW